MAEEIERGGRKTMSENTVELLRCWEKFELGMEAPPPLSLGKVADELARLRRINAELVEATTELLATTPEERQNPAVWFPRVDRVHAALRSATETNGEPT